MDALMMVGGLALAIPGMVGGMCWLDPKGAEWLAAGMRGRAVQLRMMKVAREQARARAREVARACHEEWDKESGAGEGQGQGRGLQEVVNG
jgi:UPF0716 family protein affecting phage T7 exclusion